MKKSETDFTYACAYFKFPVYGYGAYANSHASNLYSAIVRRHITSEAANWYGNLENLLLLYNGKRKLYDQSCS